MRGTRIQSVTNELNGERIDVILWDDDIAQLTINALSPAVIQSLSIHESKHSMDIAVESDQLASAIGKNGQNIKLASLLVGWKLNVMTQSQAENKQKTRHMLVTDVFKNSLDIDDDIADILIREGYNSLEEVVSASVHELAGIAEFDEDLALALIDRAKQAIVRQAISGENYHVSNLHELEHMTSEIAQQLIAHHIHDKDDLGELSVDELLEIIPMDEGLASDLILEARREWFEDEKGN
jgi:N utilization substance protein A